MTFLRGLTRCDEHLPLPHLLILAKSLVRVELQSCALTTSTRPQDPKLKKKEILDKFRDSFAKVCV